MPTNEEKRKLKAASQRQPKAQSLKPKANTNTAASRKLHAASQRQLKAQSNSGLCLPNFSVSLF
jgi:hypothetical protein